MDDVDKMQSVYQYLLLIAVSNRKRIAIAAFMLSVCCEVLQYFTGRGMADVNDVLFNTLGAAVGVWFAEEAA